MEELDEVRHGTHSLNDTPIYLSRDVSGKDVPGGPFHRTVQPFMT